MAEAIFWIFMALVFYVYVLYPVLIGLASAFFPREVAKRDYEPSVSVVISAFNEEKNIERKIQNLLDLNYPEDKLEILIGSDGASDRTDEIVSKIHSPRLRFFRFVNNMGKPNVLNALVADAKGEILVFTDARQEFAPDAVRRLVSNFHDSSVGCVSGELFFKQVGAETVSQGMDAYWRFEKFLRRSESRVGSMLGATGAIYAVRKNLFSPFPSDILVDDMYLPLNIVLKGFRAVFDERAHAFDVPSQKGSQEMTRKVRTLAGNYQIFRYSPQLFDPRKSPVVWQLVSHKLLRLLVPFFLIGVFAANLFLLGRVEYRIFLAMQILFYGLAIYEAAGEAKRSAAGTSAPKGIGFIPYTFCLLNYSAFMALIHFLTGPRSSAWKKAYV